jgi:hypothetical protein
MVKPSVSNVWPENPYDPNTVEFAISVLLEVTSRYSFEHSFDF